jgi:hypothetical protein
MTKVSRSVVRLESHLDSKMDLLKVFALESQLVILMDIEKVLLMEAQSEQLLGLSLEMYWV